jgi:CspA family cold shock protein
MSTPEHAHHSTVKWFDAKKGYGFINHPEGGDDVFVHYSQIQSEDDFKTLRTGQTVQFEMEDGPKGLHALNVLPEEEDSSAPEPESTSEPLPEDTDSPDVSERTPDLPAQDRDSEDRDSEDRGSNLSPDTGTDPSTASF